MIGIDFAEAMIQRAHQAVAEAGLQDWNIELRVADMERTKLPDAFADVLLSNCVINLCPDKDAVYKEAFRILGTGGRIAISDVVLTENIAPELRMRFQATWAGCLGGAVQEEEYWQTVSRAGFAEIRVVARYPLKGEELVAMACCPGEEFTPPPARGRTCLLSKGRWRASNSPRPSHPGSEERRWSDCQEGCLYPLLPPMIKVKTCTQVFSARFLFHTHDQVIAATPLC